MKVDQPLAWPGGPGLFDVTNGAPAVLERLSGDGATWISVGSLASITGNGIIGFDLDKSTIRASGGFDTAFVTNVPGAPTR